MDAPVAKASALMRQLGRCACSGWPWTRSCWAAAGSWFWTSPHSDRRGARYQGAMEPLNKSWRRRRQMLWALCGVANPRRSPATAAVCVSHSAQIRRACCPPEFVQRFPISTRLYDTDFYGWIRDQAAALQSRNFANLDLDPLTTLPSMRHWISRRFIRILHLAHDAVTSLVI